MLTSIPWAYERRNELAHKLLYAADNDIQAVQGKFWHWKLVNKGDLSHLPEGPDWARDSLSKYVLTPAGRAPRVVFLVRSLPTYAQTIAVSHS